MPDVSAAIGLAMLAEYDAAIAERREQAAGYIELLDRFGDIAFHRRLDDLPWQVFPCLLPSAAATAQFVEDAARQGLEVRRYYRPSLDEWGGISSAGDCPASRMLAGRMACLPIYTRAIPHEIADVHRIIEACLARSLRLAA
jgi:dTDP-4-amino-4,6-dideoxygalactose transaminase